MKTNKITRDFFASYISYARKYCQPKIPDYAVMDLVQEYCNMRNLGTSTKTITATPRQLESMIRLSEALAKMRLSDTVEKKDIQEAVRLIKTAMQQSATDPTTGKIDMDIITTGQSAQTKERVNQIKKIIEQIKESHKERLTKQTIPYANLYEYVVKKFNENGAKKQERAVNESEIRDAINQLANEGIIKQLGNQKIGGSIRFVYED